MILAVDQRADNSSSSQVTISGHHSSECERQGLKILGGQITCLAQTDLAAALNIQRI